MKHFATAHQTSIAQESAVAAVAAELTALLSVPRARRKGLAKTTAVLRKHLQALGKTVETTEREFRRTPTKTLDANPETAAARRDFKRLRMRLRSMLQIEQAVDLIRKGKKHPLFPPPPPRHDRQTTLTSIIDDGFRALHWGSAPRIQSDAARALGCFPDIPMLASRFVQNAHVAFRVLLAQQKGFETRFLDVGCGGGNMVLLAAEIFGRADGLDFDQGYVDLASRVFTNCGAKRCHAFRANALTFAGHDAYDIIYFYQPMSDPEGLKALEDQVLRHARPGTVLIAPYAGFAARAPDLDCRKIDGSVYVTGLSEPAADALRRDALRIGTDILGPEHVPNVQRLVWLNDLWMACAANGYVPD